MIHEQGNLQSRLRGVVAGRLLTGVLLIAAMLGVEWIEIGLPTLRSLADIRYLPAYWTLLVLCGVNVPYLILLRSGRWLAAQAVVQLAVDTVIISLLVYFTGIDRIFSYLYFAIVIVSALLLTARSAFAFASAATILLACVSILYSFAAVPDARLELPGVSLATIRDYSLRRSFLIPYLVSFGLSLHATAFLATLLAREMNRVRLVGQEVLENIARGVFAVDRHGKLGYANREAKALLGLSEKRARGGRFQELIRHPRIRSAIEEGLRTGRRSAEELVLDGRPFELSLLPMYEPRSARLRGIVGILTDLTFRKRLESMEKVQERFQAFVELSASLAHEVRNPLASIKGASQELLGGKGLSEEDRELFELVVREVDRLDKILSMFSEYAHPRPMRFKICDVSRILEDSAKLLEARARNRGVRIERSIQPGLMCKGDEDRLKQLFLNVGINAVESIVDGRGRVVLRGRLDGTNGARVEIQDNGEGIRPDLQGRIFDPFFTTKSNGTGMGLAIARHIVHAHRGRIEIESEVDRGTTCRIWLPA